MASAACSCRGSAAGFSGRLGAPPSSRPRLPTSRPTASLHTVASAGSQSSGSGPRPSRKDTSSVSTSALPAVAATLAMPLTEAPTTQTEVQSAETRATGLGALLGAKHVSTTAVDLGIDVSQVCVDGFCNFKQSGSPSTSVEETEEAAEAEPFPTLAGLAVSSLSVASLRPTVSPRQPMAPDSDGVGIHPDAERRLRAREARKARRRSSVVQMAKKEWWKSAVENVVEASSEDEYKTMMADAASEGKCVVVDFYAPWCQACRRQFPDVLRYAASRPDVLFVKVNASNLRPMCEDIGVERLPSYGVHVPGNDFWMTGFLSNLTSKLQAAHSPARISA